MSFIYIYKKSVVLALFQGKTLQTPVKPIGVNALDFSLWAPYTETYSLVPEWKTTLQNCKESKNL